MSLFLCFFLGTKQERTPAWYGVFTEKGEESEVVDVMQYLWSGIWSKNKAPHLYSLQINNKKAVENVYLDAGSSYNIVAVASDPDHDNLSYRWKLLPELTRVGACRLFVYITDGNNNVATANIPFFVKK